MPFKLGPRNHGSLSLAALLSLASLSAAFLYSLQASRQTHAVVEEASVLRAQEAGQTSNLSQFSLLRGLMSESKLPSGAGYEPAVYPNNYFAKNWDLKGNQEFDLKHVKTKNNTVTVRSITPEAAAGTEIVDQTQSQPGAPGGSQTLEIIQANYDSTHPYYVSSVDVKARRKVAVEPNAKGANAAVKEVLTVGRISLSAPVPQAMRILISPAGSATFTDNFGTKAKPLDPGKYVLQMRGRGVIHHGEIEANGKTFIVGLNSGNNISHQANNIKADVVLGQTEPLDLKEIAGVGSEDVKEKGCSLAVSKDATAGIAATSVKVRARLIGVDGNEATKLSVNKTIIVRTEVPPPVLTGGPTCENSCPTAASNVSKQNLPLTLDRYLAGEKFDIFEAKKTAEIRGKTAHGIMCSSYALVAMEIRNKTGMNPSELERSNPRLFNETYAKAVSLKQYVSYLAPDCQREVVGVRDNCGCFAADTTIQIADGSLKPASEIRSGDLVWNPKTKRTQAIRRVIAGPERWPLLKVKTGGKSVLVTGEHPFLTTAGLKAAYEIRAGDIILDGDEQTEVESVEAQIRKAGESDPEVWNFELEGGSSPDDHYVLANGIMTGDLFLQMQLSGKMPGDASVVD